MGRHELTEAEWARLWPLLPPERPRVGRPNKDHRTVVNGILWKLATGAPWRDLPERFGPWQSVYTRFRRWTRGRVGPDPGRAPAAGRRGGAARLGHELRGRHGRPRPPARGGRKKGGPDADQALGRSRG